MSTIKTAKGVLYELKKAGYEAFIVGGTVRDHLLNIEVNDVDITTNARPYQVAEIFRTVPTGLKYGTVTVLYKDEQFEVTTYREDGTYLDGRRPEKIEYSDSAEEDVKRRDFTINGLLMTEKSEIIDYVGGQDDLRYKMIRTIGDPEARFNEDALRMLRAFYFQAKLGFQIDKQTREAIQNNRKKIHLVSNERILNELLKTLSGPHLKKALKSMVTTTFHEELPGLKKGIEAVLEMDEMPYIDVFFTLCFALNDGIIPSEWKFSNKHRHRYAQAAKLANSQPKYDAYELYTYGLELSLLANRVNYQLGREKLMRGQIEERYEKIPLQSELDLKLRASEMITLTKKKAGAWVKDIQQQMILKILKNELKNDKKSLTTFLMEQMK